MLKINIGKHKLAIFAAFFISINIVSAIRVKHAHIIHYNDIKYIDKILIYIKNYLFIFNLTVLFELFKNIHGNE
jgi:hypothetical protein